MAGRRAFARAGAAVLVAVLLSSCGPLDASNLARGLRPGINAPRELGEVSAAPLGVPALAPTGEGGYTFLRLHKNGSPVSFDPCRQLHYVVRPYGAPTGGRELLDSVLAEIALATGLKFVDDGATDEAPTETRSPYQRDRYGDRWAPVLIAWSDPDESPELAGRVLGRAGPDVFGSPGDADERFVSGTAVFNGPELEWLLTSGNEDKARAVLLHELGHLVGLGHVTDAYQVMFDTNANPLSEYAAGDLRGLEQLGMGRCFRDY